MSQARDTPTTQISPKNATKNQIWTFSLKIQCKKIHHQVRTPNDYLVQATGQMAAAYRKLMHNFCTKLQTLNKKAAIIGFQNF